MTVHFTEGKHITLPNQPEGERVQRGDEKKKIPKQGSKGSQWSPDAVCLKAAKTLARVPHTTREGHRGLLSATGGSGEPSQNICETKSTARGEENYSPLVVENVLLLFNLCFWLADIHQECLFEKVF